MPRFDDMIYYTVREAAEKRGCPTNEIRQAIEGKPWVWGALRVDNGYRRFLRGDALNLVFDELDGQQHGQGEKTR
ncbi:MAG: hypothetical protein LUC33_04745 [Prevotellaceae bacterium]|nr:hypothetical protein [Prevotellaceae bacterium]